MTDAANATFAGRPRDSWSRRIRAAPRRI